MSWAFVLNAHKINNISEKKLASLIKSSGYYNIKTKRLKAFMDFLLKEYNGNVENMKNKDILLLRKALLIIKGIGPETADSILLYALNKPVFVIDAYTKRILSRHNIMDFDKTYDEFQSLFHENIERDVRLFNEYDALLIRVGKIFCKTKPLCHGKSPCPLNSMFDD